MTKENKMLEMNRKIKRGFTLTEILVAIAIIGILSGAALVAYNSSGLSFKKKNTQAISDLMKVKSALENYYAKNGKYPSSRTGAAGAGVWDGYCRPGGVDSLGIDWIPDLKADYFPDGMPIEPDSKAAGNCTSGGANSSKQYIYNSDSYNYKLIYLEPQSMSVPSNLIDPLRPTRAYGFWTEGAKNW